MLYTGAKKRAIMQNTSIHPVRPRGVAIVKLVIGLFMFSSSAMAGTKVSKQDVEDSLSVETHVVIESETEWQASKDTLSGLEIIDGQVIGEGTYASKLLSFDSRTQLSQIIFEQGSSWDNWAPTPRKVAPTTLQDAPVLLAVSDKSYWLFGRYEGEPGENEIAGKGSEQPSLGGYHAWHSEDMLTWTHHGPVTDERSRWMTTAEYVDGKFLLYYDYPNDQDPHLFVDEDLFDGKLGQDVGKVFADLSNGSDAGVMRDLDGSFNLIYEDWTPINPKFRSWDSPLAGRAVSPNGITPFKTAGIAVDYRTTPTGKIDTYPHPHWLQHPDFTTRIGDYEVHSPKQDAFGDWTMIRVGDEYYLFGDYEPATPRKRHDGSLEPHISLGILSSETIDGRFEFVGSIGDGHPDPSVGFAEGQFYLITQTEEDFVSPGPWVDGVTARAGVDKDGDGEVDVWTEWQSVKEHYRLAEGYSRVVEKTDARLDLSGLPSGFGVKVEFKMTKAKGTPFSPEMNRITIQ